MENSKLRLVDPAAELDEIEQLPREEVIVRLLEFVNRYATRSNGSGLLCPYSVARAAENEGPVHRFGFGCCRGYDLAAEQRARDASARALAVA